MTSISLTQNRPNEKRATIAMMALCLLVFSSAFGSYFQTQFSLGPNRQGSLLRQGVYLLVFTSALWCADNRIRTFGRIPMTFWLMFLWSFLSLTWSISADTTMRRLLLTFIVTFSAFLLVWQLGYERTVGIFRRVVPFALLINYVTVLLWPETGVASTITAEDFDTAGTWQGLMGNKNAAGPFCAVTILFFMVDVRRVRLALRISVVAASSYFLFRTESKTSIGVMLSSLLVGWSFRFYQPRYRVVAAHVTVLLFSIIGLMAWRNWDLFRAILGRPESFTGRAEIWSFLFRYISEHFLLGAGFGSFWNVGKVSPIYSYTNGWISEIASGHNGYLDLLTQVGLPGLILAVVAAFIGPIINLFNSEGIDRSRSALLLSLIWFALLHNFSESSLFNGDFFLSLTLTVAIALLGVLKLYSAQVRV